MNFSKIDFVLSVHHLKQLPTDELPEVAFAGRSNVGKSSLINKLVGRKKLVKVSGRPGKTQGLNFFDIGGDAYFVDLPGYGYAKVSKGMKEGWQTLITKYLESRDTLKCVVLVLDLRHGPKKQDTQLLDWLRELEIPFLPVYTKMDKLSGNQRAKNASILDKGHGLKADDRVMFSAKTGQGREALEAAIEKFIIRL